MTDSSTFHQLLLPLVLRCLFQLTLEPSWTLRRDRCDNMWQHARTHRNNEGSLPISFLDMACTWRECRLQLLQMSMEPIQPSQDALKLKRAEGEKASSLIRAAFCRDITGCKHRHAETCHQWFCAINWHSRQQQLRKQVEATRQEQLRQDLQKQCRDS